MNGSTIIKVAGFIFAAIVVAKLLGELAGIITSGWFIVAALVVWYFGFHKKKQSSNR